MKKFQVAIVSSGQPLESILAAIDLNNIQICALFSFWEEITNSSKEIFKNIFRPFDMLSTTCNKCGAEYFLVNIHQNIDRQIINKLINKGINKENIIGMWPFGSIPQFNYMYFLQWKYLTTPPPQTSNRLYNNRKLIF